MRRLEKTVDPGPQGGKKDDPGYGELLQRLDG